MDDINQKSIKDIVEAYTGKNAPKPKIKPILAHASVNTVRLNTAKIEEELEAFKGIKVHPIVASAFEALDNYSYVFTLIEKNGKYHSNMKAYLKEKDAEYPVLQDQRVFPKTEHGRMKTKDYMREPFKVFQREKHIKVATFKNSDMTEEDFENLIELWRTQQITN